MTAAGEPESAAASSLRLLEPERPPLVAVEGVSKRFGGAQALESVSVSIRRGEVHGLVGENGAGKSTLGRIIAGLVAPDEGAVVVEGERLSPTPRHALRLGITMIAQELVLLPSHTVLDNVFLGVEVTRGALIRRGVQAARFRELNAQTGFGLDANARVESLRVAEQQLVEVMRGLTRDARLIVMDEPTAALSGDEAAKLLAIVRALRERGTTVIFVSHRLEDVLRVADTVTVLRNGRVVRTAPAAEETSATLVTAMLGRDADLTFPKKRRPAAAAPVMLSVSDLRFPGGDGQASLDVRAGEIVGIAGLVGSGRSELAQAIFGAVSGVSGAVQVADRRLQRRSPRAAIRAGLFLLPEDRRDRGLLMGRTVQENVTIANLAKLCVGPIVRRRAEREAAAGAIRDLEIRPARRAMPVNLLSGGNQQRVMMAKARFCEPRVLILDEPTRGVDVGARRGIHELLMRMADQGLAILLISSEFEELVGLAHRILVMRAGRVVGEFPGDTDEKVLVRVAVMGE